MSGHDDSDSELSSTIKSLATYHEAPRALSGNIMAAVKRLDPNSWKAHSRPFWQRPWMHVGLAFACGVFVSLVLTWLYNLDGAKDRLAQEVVASHVRSLMLAHLADIASSDQHTVKPWFSGKLDFSPPVIDLAREGFPLVGGRLDYLDQHPVAALVYSYRKHTINLLVWPSGAISPPGLKMLSRHGFNVAYWEQSGMQFWAVSDLNAGKLESFAALLYANGSSSP